jgi:uncharacterized membrane protein YczE
METQYTEGEFLVLVIFAIIAGIWLLSKLIPIIIGLLPIALIVGVVWGMYAWFPHATETIFTIIFVPVGIWAVITGLSTVKKPLK